MTRVGILPRAGGWLDQDAEDVLLINLASAARNERMVINQQKQERRAKRKGNR